MMIPTDMNQVFMVNDNQIAAAPHIYTLYGCACGKIKEGPQQNGAGKILSHIRCQFCRLMIYYQPTIVENFAYYQLFLLTLSVLIIKVDLFNSYFSASYVPAIFQILFGKRRSVSFCRASNRKLSKTGEDNQTSPCNYVVAVL